MGKKPRGSGEPRASAGVESAGKSIHGDPDSGPAWPAWARRLASLAIVFHLAAVLAGALGVPPSSQLERSVADLFTWYFDLVDLGYSYRYYAEPPPTPVVTATLSFGPNQEDQTFRLPGREVSGPRLRHQRQLALANSLYNDAREARARTGDVERSRLARSFARHLCVTHPGCQRVTLHLTQHLIPDPDRVREEIASPAYSRFDLFAADLFTTPEWLGDYPCDGF
jgi:hypothetical protein